MSFYIKRREMSTSMRHLQFVISFRFLYFLFFLFFFVIGYWYHSDGDSEQYPTTNYTGLGFIGTSRWLSRTSCGCRNISTKNDRIHRSSLFLFFFISWNGLSSSFAKKNIRLDNRNTPFIISNGTPCYPFYVFDEDFKANRVPIVRNCAY